MSIQKKLMILLFSVTLIPLIIVVALYQTTIFFSTSRVSDDILKTLDESARYNLQRMLDDYESRLRLNIQLIEAVLQMQVNSVEEVLRRSAEPIKFSKEGSLGFIGSLKPPADSIPFHQKRLADGTFRKITIDFRRQDLFLPQGVSQDPIRSDASRLANLTTVYHKLFYMLPHDIYWQHTSLKNGLHTSYPAGATFPKSFDPRKREWYLWAERQNEITWSNPYIDALSGKAMLTIASPVNRPDGTFAGITAIDILVSSVFEWMELNPRWANNAEGKLILRESEGDSVVFKIFASMNYRIEQDRWDQPLKLRTLESDDEREFSALLQDLNKGKSGVRKMLFKGKECLWIYRGFEDRMVYPLLIVPYENVILLASETEDYLLKKNFEGIRYVVLLVVLVIFGLVVMSFRRAKSFTQPIHSLADSARKLGEGDYTARAGVQTGDELEQLGNVFNQLGPKLQEHQKMQSSLELARNIQQRLLPKSAPKLQNFDIAGMCQYSDETGGDYYDYMSMEEIEPGKVSVMLGDVTGYGIGAALLMASARSLLRNNIRYFKYDLSKILFEFNNEMTRDTDSDKFITLFIGVLQNEGRSITWALGGHDPAIWYRESTDEYEELGSQGVPIGFVPNMSFEQAGPVNLFPGDVITIGTDGIWEAPNETGEMFGKERLREVIRKHKKDSAENICQAIIQSVLEFTLPHPQDDDITVVVIKAV
jgi:sigma-B regulation protein RsbU (phosphoserine phosphatase)